MDCSRCSAPAVIGMPYSGAHLCETHFIQSVDRRVRKRIRADGLLDATATPENPDTWVIGLSGGKDSAVLTHILAETFAEDPRVELRCLTIHEGIEGYRDKSLEACIELVEQLDLDHEIVTYADEFDIQMDDVVESDPFDMAACAYCGVFRRDILDRYAARFDADKLLTGHNLDDEAQTALMNVLEGNVDQIVKHFEASLGKFDGNDAEKGDQIAYRAAQDRFIPRAKPLRDIPEKEVALYCHLAELPAHVAECPHAADAYRGEIQHLLFDLEDEHPGTRHSIMAGYEEIAGIVASYYNDNGTGSESDRTGNGTGTGTGTCVECGATTFGERCRRCELLRGLREE